MSSLLSSKTIAISNGIKQERSGPSTLQHHRSVNLNDLFRKHPSAENNKLVVENIQLLQRIVEFSRLVAEEDLMAVFGGDFLVFVVDCFDGVELLKKWLVMLCSEGYLEG